MNREAPTTSNAPDTVEPSDAMMPLRRLGMLLFLGSLAMLFIAGLIGYLKTRYSTTNGPDPATLALPFGLWISTVLLLLSGVSMLLVHRNALRGRLNVMEWAMPLTMVLTVAFLAVQVPCLWYLLEAHSTATAQGTGLYGLTAFLIIVHGLHVLGGLIPMTRLSYKAIASKLTPANLPAVRTTAMYWHFLEVVWLVMFAVFLVTA